MSDLLATLVALVVALLGAGVAGYALAGRGRAPALPPAVPQPDTSGHEAEADRADREAASTDAGVRAALEREDGEAPKPSGLADVLRRRSRPP